MRFDVVGFLQDKGIAYKISGKNLSSEWVGLQQCPFCLRQDHIAINLNSGAYNCWVCGKHGYAADVLRHILGLRVDEVRELMRPYYTLPGGPLVRERRTKAVPGRILEIPPHFASSWSQAYTNYMTSRGYDISVIQQFQLMASGPWDKKWCNRIIIPFHQQGQLVSWTGRTILPDVDPRYKNLSNEDSLIDVRSTIFNIDNMGKRAILVEGAFDAFKVGQSVGAVIGLEFTNEQCLLIKRQGVEELSIVFDAEDNAQRRAERLGKVMSTFGIKTYVVDIRGSGFKDPGMFTPEAAAELRRECLGISFE